MKHGKHVFKIGRTSSHRRCLIANMIKDLVIRGRIKTTERKAKELKRRADKMITLAKKNTVASRRLAIARLMIRHNKLTQKEQKLAKAGDTKAYNGDRLVIGKLFNELGVRFANRNGGYTRIIKEGFRKGDSAPMCYIEFLEQ
jgi:large subunit ribosomal protein L17